MIPWYDSVTIVVCSLIYDTVITGVCCLISSCEQLELLDVTDCIHVSNVSLTFAIDKSQQTPSNKTLKLFMTGDQLHFFYYLIKAYKRRKSSVQQDFCERK